MSIYVYLCLSMSIYVYLAQSRDVETSPKGLCRKTGHRCEEGEKQSRACEKIAASVVLVAQRAAVWISTRAIWVCIINCFSCVKSRFIQNNLSFDLSRIFFSFFAHVPVFFHSFSMLIPTRRSIHPSIHQDGADGQTVDELPEMNDASQNKPKRRYGSKEPKAATSKRRQKDSVEKQDTGAKKAKSKAAPAKKLRPA